MVTDCCSKKKSSYWSLAGFVYIIINIRVAAGLATVPERILDASVALYTLAFLLYTGAKFFNLIEERKGNNTFLFATTSTCQESQLLQKDSRIINRM